MKVNWKLLGEGVAIAVLVYLVTLLVDFDAAAVTNWHTWLTGLLSGTIRTAAGAALAIINQQRQT